MEIIRLPRIERPVTMVSPAMHVRPADIDTDALAIMEGAKDFISRIDFGDWTPTDDAELAAAIGHILALDGVEVAVAVEDEAIVGALGVIYAPYIWNRTLTMAEELFFWTAPDAPVTAALRLLRFMRRRATEKRVAIVSFKALNTSPANLERVYRALGLRPVEATYMGVI